MQPKTFFAFVGPSLAMMFTFIALPLCFVFVQSFYVVQDEYEVTFQEVCKPTFNGQVCGQEEKLVAVLDDDGNPKRLSNFVGLETYKILLDTEMIGEWLDDPEATFEELVEVLSGIDFFRALRFTLTFTLVTLPLVLLIGLGLAIALNRISEQFRGVLIFVSLLPFIITPVIGAISIKWLFVGDGMMTVFLEYLLETEIAVFSNGWAIEALMMFYRVWHVAPFAFVVFYASLQSVDQSLIDAALVDGANRWERLRFIIIPHLMPLIIFVSLIHLMDSFRVFEEIIGFSAEAYRISLQYLTFEFLTPDDAGTRAIARASASSVLTMMGIIILLLPMLRRTYKDHKRGAH